MSQSERLINLVCEDGHSDHGDLVMYRFGDSVHAAVGDEQLSLGMGQDLLLWQVRP